MNIGAHERQVGRGWRSLIVVVLAAFGAFEPGGGRVVFAEETFRVSLTSGGAQVTGASTNPSISADGEIIAFESDSDTLVEGDTNGTGDIFVRLSFGGITRRISRGYDGSEANGDSSNPRISANGRYVVFDSLASNIVPGDTNNRRDVFLHDLQTEETVLVSVGSGNPNAAFGSSEASVSADGRYVVFTSDADNLVPGDTNGFFDVFLRDMQTQVTTRISVGPGAQQANSGSREARISADGSTIVFTSLASNLVPDDINDDTDVFAYDRVTGAMQRISITPGGGNASGNSFDPSVSADGRFVTFRSEATDIVPGDTNGKTDAFTHDRAVRETLLSSFTPLGQPLEADVTGATISGDGRFVAYQTTATSVIPGQSNAGAKIVMMHRYTGTIIGVSVPASGQLNGDSGSPSISANGRYIAFDSAASNLVPGDTNDDRDVFVRNAQVGAPIINGVTLQGRTPSAPAAGHGIATISLNDGLTASNAATGIYFLYMVLDGDYVISACAPGYLCAQRAITVVNGAVQGGLTPVQLRAGDVDGDGDVDISDITKVIGGFGTRPPDGTDASGNVIDINGDGVVNIHDVTLPLSNFGRKEPGLWQ